MGKAESGKSRLAFEFCRHIQGAEWKAVFLPCYFFEDINRTNWEYPQNLFIVVDYVAYYGREIGQWLKRLSDARTTHKIRVLLLEREGFNDEKVPIWYSSMESGFGGYLVKDLRYKAGEQLSIPSLRDEEKAELIRETLQMEHSTAKPCDVERMIELLNSIDPNGERPLYLLFMLQAYMEQGSDGDWKRWEPDDLHNDVFKREINRIDGIINKQDQAELSYYRELIMRIWSFATVSGAMNLDDIQSTPCLRCSKEWMERERVTRYLMRGMLRSVSSGGDSDVEPYEPDIVGEYFVLQSMLEADHDERMHFIQQAWERAPLRTAQFLGLASVDHGDRLHFDELLDIGRGCWMNYEPNDEKHIQYYAFIMLGHTYHSSAEKTYSAVHHLEEVYKRNEGNAEIALGYAQGLFNLTVVQESEEAIRGTVDRLEEVYERNEGNAEIALAYVQGLFNLTVVQESEEARRGTVDRLEGVYERNEGNAEIALRYAQGLFNLTVVQESEEAIRGTVDRLEGVYERNEGNAEIALVYAQGLFNLTVVQESEEARRGTVDRLEGVYERNEGNAEIALVYAQGLANLTVNQESEEAIRGTVDRLEEVYERNEGNAEIALEYAQGLSNLTVVQESEEARRGDSGPTGRGIREERRERGDRA